jgi:signal transduction histidine kinase
VQHFFYLIKFFYKLTSNFEKKICIFAAKIINVLYILLFILGLIIGSVITFRKSASKVDYLMDSLEAGEMNFRFKETNALNRALNRLRKILEKFRQENETESWSKLIRVLTHEIMNTITPVAALSEALANDDSLDTKAGLETIAASSKDLIKFIDSYRSLSKISKPAKRPIVVSDMIRKVVALNEKFLEASNVKCSTKGLYNDITIFADEGQISQILINLIKNAVQAQSKNIEISVSTNKNGQVSIIVSDDGMPISHENKEQIFVPFYTTKSGGSGIGLSLSRQIMRLHNGTIDLLQSDNEKTAFVIMFS